MTRPRLSEPLVDSFVAIYDDKRRLTENVNGGSQNQPIRTSQHMPWIQELERNLEIGSICRGSSTKVLSS
jgi:hypothetical protein